MKQLPACIVAVSLAGIPGQSALRHGLHVEFVRVPNGGIQPEVAVDGRGTIHLVYLAGEPSTADVFYVRSSDGGRSFSAAVKVNSRTGSAIATGTIRGAQLAIGRRGRIHVAWNGSSKALPLPPADPKTGRPGMPVLYARSGLDGGAFEPQRNLMTKTTHLDGGGSIAADDRGGVYVAWHANGMDAEGGEAARRVWIARSMDDGATFTPERAISDPSTGACGCCALRLAAGADGLLHLLYRSARDTVHRDIYSLISTDGGEKFAGTPLHAWEIGACPMTSMSIVPASPALYAWETEGQVYFDRARRQTVPSAPSIGAGATPGRKHPRLAVNAAGTVLLVWAEGTAWNRGGSVVWQAFSPDGKPAPHSGSRTGVPVWSFAGVAARHDGSFVVFY